VDKPPRCLFIFVQKNKCRFRLLWQEDCIARKGEGKITYNPSPIKGSNNEGEIALDEVLEMLDKTAKRIQKVFDETKETASKHIAAHEQLLKSKDASEEQKIKAFMGKTLELDRLERLSSQLSLLYALQIFAFKVKVLEISVGNISEQLAQSGVLQKSAELEDIKKNINALKVRVEAQSKSVKEIREDQSKNLTYIH
jgi:hypothetical protein